MKKILVSLLLCLSAAAVNANTLATMPNKAGGKIVLTDRDCISNGKTYESLNRGYNYTESGYTQDACWWVEGETVVMYWLESKQTMRYPIENFTFNRNYKNKNKYGY